MRTASKIAVAIAVMAVSCSVLVMCASRHAQGAGLFGSRAAPEKPLPPRYAKIALTNDPSKVLSVVFSASKGTASGYDQIAADLAPSVDLERARKLTAKSTKQPARAVCVFPPMPLQLPGPDASKDDPTSCSIFFCYCKEAGGENFCVTSRMAIQQGSTNWHYSARGTMKPSESAGSAPLLELGRSPELTIETKPDLNKKGNLGIALALKAGQGTIECRKSGGPLDAHVEIKTPAGKVVHQDTQAIDKFAFG